MSLPYFPLYPSDFEAKTSHLSMLEDGAYNRLLRLCWMTPGCSLPDDEAWIMRRARAHTKAEKDAVRTILTEFFTREKGRVFQPRLTREAMLASDAHQRRVEAGRLGGLKSKPLKTKDTEPSNAKAKPKQPEPEPLRDPHTPKGEFADFWEVWPNKVAEVSALRAWGKIPDKERPLVVAAAAPWFAWWRKTYPDAKPISATKFLNGRRWKDEGFSAKPADPVDIRSALADRIRSGKPYLVRDITPATARELIAAGLVTEDECRKAGIA